MIASGTDQPQTPNQSFQRTAMMDLNWGAIGAIAEMFGAAGVIASLIYLASQIRQSTRQSFAASYQSRAESSGHIFGELSMSNGLPEIFLKARSLGLPGDSAKLCELTPIEVAKLRSYYTEDRSILA